MTSIAVLIISIFTIIAVTGEAVDLQTDIDLTSDLTSDLTEVASEKEGCPYLDYTEYKVIVRGSVSTLNGGCAYINYNNSSDIKSQTFSLWFGNIYQTAENCRDSAIEYFRFYCVSKSPSPSEDIRKGRMFIKLYDDGVHKVERQTRRCAVYEKTDDDYVSTLRLAISSNDSCDSLSDILDHPEKIRLHKRGAMLLTFSRTRPDAPLTPAATTTTTETIQPITNQYEIRGYLLQNRPNPYWRTKTTKTQHRDERELHMSDADGRYRAVKDLSSYEYLHSYTNDKDVGMSAIKDTEHTQMRVIRRKRSKSLAKKNN